MTVKRQKSGQVICLGHGKVKINDFRLFKTSSVKFRDLFKVIADQGYQGIAKFHQSSTTPIKKSKGRKLAKQQKEYNPLTKSIKNCCRTRLIVVDFQYFV